MIIHNVRVGFATNSSSVHSIILIPPEEHRTTETNEYLEFGWNHFTAANIESKENYLGITLRENLVEMMGESNADLVLEGIFPLRDDVPTFSEAIKKGYIDHQSLFSLPVNWNGKGVDVEFFQALRDYFLGQPIAILGGNDNDDDGRMHPLLGSGACIDLGLPEDSGLQMGLVARNDGTHWVLFNRNSGTKVRLTLGRKQWEAVGQEAMSKGPQVPVSKARTPELVDIKITDFCPKGCKYCYQGSTPEGKHSRHELIYSLAYALGKLKVFEVALGGGEPTLHPDFPTWLRVFRDAGIVPSFSTGSLEWLKNPGRKYILEKCGAFAYSVTSPKEVKAFGRLVKEVLEENPVSRGKSYAQYVLGVGGDLHGVLEEARKQSLRVTLLGFKRAGFGRSFKEKPEDWVSVVRRMWDEHSYPYIGVDTAIVRNDFERIKGELGVHEALMTGKEGKFSMYIDAVNRTMGPSSYCDPSQLVLLQDEDNKVTDKWIEIKFREW